MDGLDLAPASTLDRAALADLFNRSYTGYFTTVALSPDALETMNAANDVDHGLSSVARLGGVACGLVLVARRGERGWIGGMGVTPEARGRGLGRELMAAALASSRGAGLTSVQLEVIEENRWAIAVYETAGFDDVRRLEVWVRAPGPVPAGGSLPDARRIDAAIWIGTLDRREVTPRPWQRETVALSRGTPPEAYAVEANDVPLAGLALRREGPRVAVLDIAGSPEAPAGSIEAALRTAIAAHPDAAFTMINLAESDRARETLVRLGFEPRFRQREMVRRIP